MLMNFGEEVAEWFSARGRKEPVVEQEIQIVLNSWLCCSEGLWAAREQLSCSEPTGSKVKFLSFTSFNVHGIHSTNRVVSGFPQLDAACKKELLCLTGRLWGTGWDLGLSLSHLCLGKLSCSPI